MVAPAADKSHIDTRNGSTVIPDSFAEEFNCQPFIDSVPFWRQAGWLGTIPLPPKAKNPPPKDWTGRAAGFPDDGQVAAWSSEPAYEYGNIGLHLGWPVTVDGKEYETAGIDADHYTDGDKAKCGGDQLTELEREHGPLPPTWVSTARARNDDGTDRGDWTSGIRLYLVPRGLAFRGQAAPDIEVIQKSHRFAVVWPSFNPKSETTYRLYSPSDWAEHGQPLDPYNGDEIPDVTTLPVLPARWVDYLTQGRMRDSARPIDMDSTPDEMDEWAESQFRDGDELCTYMRQRVQVWAERIRGEATSHDKIRDAHWNLYRLGAEGHTGWRVAVEQVNGVWTDDVISRDKREADELRREVFRSRMNALRKVKAAPGSQHYGKTPCACVALKSTGNNVTTQPNTAPVVIQAKFTDSGLAEVVAQNVLRGKFLRLANANSWLQWDGMRWRNLGRDDGPVVESVRQYVLFQVADAATRSINDASVIVELEAWKRVASRARIKAVLELARNLAAVDMNAIDAEPYFLNTPNGTYDLHNCEFLPHNPDDRLTRITQGAYYEPGDESVSNLPRYGVKWVEFLNRIIPDPDTRRYLQKAMGAALVGRLKEKKLFIFNGSGDNGKNVFWEAIHFALGDSQTGGYATVSRADLLDADGKDRQLLEMGLKNARVAFISETNKKIALAEGIVKKLTGDKLITSRTHYQEHETFVQSASVVLITNKLPSFTGGDIAMRNRLRVIPFSVQIPEAEQDKSLGESLELEADAVLTWLIDGYCDYLENGLTEPEEIELATGAYHRDNDLIGRAIAATCVVDVDIKSEKKLVKNAILSWLTTSGSRDGGAGIRVGEVQKALDERGYVTTRSNGETWLRGIRIKTDDERNAERSGDE